MNRRNFLQAVALVIGAVVAGVLPKFADEEDHYWRAFEDRLRRITRRGYKVEGFTLEAPEDGFRFASIDVGEKWPLTFYVNWGAGEEFAVKLEYENKIRDFGGCYYECGQPTGRQHLKWCRGASALWDSDEFKTISRRENARGLTGRHPMFKSDGNRSF
jgi:hypothetical protein